MCWTNHGLSPLAALSSTSPPPSTPTRKAPMMTEHYDDEPTAKTTAVHRPEYHLTDEDAKLICHLKKDYLWTVAELAERMEVSEESIRKVLKGDSHGLATRSIRPKTGTRVVLPRYPRVTR